MALLNLLLAQPGINLDSVVAVTGSTALLGAAMDNKYEAVEALLNAGADPNIRAIDGDTALFKAINAQAVQSFQFIVANNSTDIKLKDLKGNDPVAVVLSSGLEEKIAAAMLQPLGERGGFQEEKKLDKDLTVQQKKLKEHEAKLLKEKEQQHFEL
jgi:ankyrin repeat protein